MTNEDRIGIFAEVGLLIVADGLGGAAAGEVAAQMAVDCVREGLIDSDVTWPRGVDLRETSPRWRLKAAIERANHCIHEASRKRREWLGMGTTIAAVLDCGDRAVVAHVGDSRVLRVRNRRFERLTEDHSLFNEFVRAGLASAERPEEFEYRNMVTRALGSDATVEVDTRWIDIAPGDTLALYTDGVSATLDEETITEILVEHRSLDHAVQELIRRANDRGGPDNIGVVLARWELAAAPIAPHAHGPTTRIDLRQKRGRR